MTRCCLLIFLQLSVSLPVLAVDRPLPDITICYNYNCNRSAHVRPAADEWNTVVNQFKPAARSAVEERQMIRRAIAVLEHIAGTQTPTFRDRGRNPIVDDWPGQMDCTLPQGLTNVTETIIQNKTVIGKNLLLLPFISLGNSPAIITLASATPSRKPPCRFVQMSISKQLKTAVVRKDCFPF